MTARFDQSGRDEPPFLSQETPTNELSGQSGPEGLGGFWREMGIWGKIGDFGGNLRGNSGILGILGKSEGKCKDLGILGWPEREISGVSGFFGRFWSGNLGFWGKLEEKFGGNFWGGFGGFGEGVENFWGK